MASTAPYPGAPVPQPSNPGGPVMALNTNVVHAANPPSLNGTTPTPPGLTPSPLTLKAREEILTSRHLIKDIRRLETYQRNFFLKVKESLNHVQLLLDHQLMDMAWSDTLMDCEDSLLQASVHLGSASPAQIKELYAVLHQDREKLNHRFQDLSVKSSLSEYLVNSHTLLDVETVHLATEAILRNEKPIQPKPDKIPVDHTFFLANFCTTSIASSLRASFMPKRENYRNLENTTGPKMDISSPSGHHSSGNSSSPTQMDKSGLKSPAMMQQQQQPPLQGVDKRGNYYSGSGDVGASTPVMNKSASLNNGPYNGGEFVAGRGNMPMTNTGQQRPPPTVGSPALSHGPAAVSPANVQQDPENVYGGQELAVAISQITRRESGSSPTKKGQVGTPTDLWRKEDGNIIPSKDDSGMRRGIAKAAVGSAGSGSFIAQNGYENIRGKTSSGGPGPSESHSTPTGGPPGPQDASADSVTSEPEDGGRMSQTQNSYHPSGGMEFDNSKPLSFALIASRNLEKQMARQQVSTANGQHKASNTMTPNMIALTSSVSSQGGKDSQDVHAANNSVSGTNNQAVSILNLAPSNNPRYFFDIAMEGRKLGRVIIEVQLHLAPRMAQNFGMLVTGEKGFGYKGCHFFQAWKNESVICGDWEHNSGRGGRAALDGGPLFTPDETKLPCVRGAVGMRRMSKKHSSLNQVASQFRIILANMNTQFTGIFGHVVSGIEALDKVANIGGEGGRPEKTASVVNCGIFKG